MHDRDEHVLHTRPTMLSRVNEELLRAKERVEEKRKLEMMLAETQRQLHELQQHCFTHSQSFGVVQADLKDPDEITLSSLLVTILGTKGQRLEKMNQDELFAKLERAKAAEAVEFAQLESTRLEQRLAEFRDAECDYSRLIEEKHRLLVETRDSRAESLGNLAARLRDLDADCLELGKAINEGTAALNSLERLRADLRAAEDVSPGEELGDAFKATKEQLRRIEMAGEHARAAKRLLCKFREQLADASLRIHVTVHTDRLATCIEPFFGEVIADRVVKSKTREASSSCGIAIAAVIATLAECRRQLFDVQEQLAATRDQHHRLIEEA